MGCVECVGLVDEAAIVERYRLLSDAGALNERTRRLWAAAEARSQGWGGISAVARTTGLHENTIRRGVRELESGEALEEGRVRRLGAGRPSIGEQEPGLREARRRYARESGVSALVDQPQRSEPDGRAARAGVWGGRKHGAPAASGAGVQPPVQPQDA